MRPSKKGWISDYLSFLMEYIGTGISQQEFMEDLELLTHDEKLYKLFQPTGLMYGHPIQVPGNYELNMQNWSDHEKMKMVFLDSLFSQAIMAQKSEIQNKSDLADCLNESLEKVIRFYHDGSIYEEKSSSFFKQKNKSGENVLESIIEQRIHIKPRYVWNFWAGFFDNSLLFLDVYYYGIWLKKKTVLDDFSLFYEQQEKLRLVILQIIALAAQADHTIQKEEKALFNFFLQSANLKKENEQRAIEFLNSDLQLSDIELDDYDNWIIKKYILELAILTVWSDKTLIQEEKDFIKLLASKLNISDQELDSSMLATESFVLSNWENIHFLQSKHDFFIVKDRFVSSFSKVAEKNKKAFVQEVQESKELMELILKMNRSKLTESEKLKVKNQLIDILKTLPTFVIIALPGTFITLPLLLKFLPRSAFPSAFGEIE